MAFTIVGVCVGATAWAMAFFEEWLLEKRIYLAQKIVNSGHEWLAWLFLCFWVFSFGVLGSAMTIYIGPGAAGSGLAELMAYLNGVNYPGMIGYKVLFSKIVCVVFGISAALCIGKEGPLAHIGSIMGLAVIYLIPIKAFDQFKNDKEKREFVCAGMSAGVSAAFASPIGGALFSYEMSKPNTFWTFSMIWRTFFCSAISTFTLSFLF